MVDPRFVAESDALVLLDERPNLMELSPTEFEALIQNLFAKMGLDTKQTRASRDGGVDCVAYDPRPIFGGKVVIQAKRYKNTVGVSAVRDLFGTLQNEGASKGILVATSGYGQASFDFAQKQAHRTHRRRQLALPTEGEHWARRQDRATRRLGRPTPLRRQPGVTAAW